MVKYQNNLWSKLSPVQWVMAIVGLLVIVFLIIGTLNQPVATESQIIFELQAQPFLILAFLAFSAGLLSFVSPCTLPILPAYFAFAFASDRKQIALNTVIFMLGLATMFSLMGAGASVIGRVLLQNQQLILLVGGALVLIFGVMSLLGQGFSGIQQEDGVAWNAGVGGAYLFGLTFAIGWSSCVGPILATVLAMAATVEFVLHGVILGFIYALGLGLPLVLVSTFFGRTSRKSLFWRILRGRGWHVTIHALFVGLLWALAVWQILVAIGTYMLRNFNYGASQTLTVEYQIGLLAIAVLGIVLWVYTSPQEKIVTLHLHSTQLISGALFVVVGILMLNGMLATFNNLIPPDLALWFADMEEWLIVLFQ
jgi:cytochrome c-type biogenesis protein